MLFTAKCAVVLKLCTQYNQCSTMAPFQFEYIKIEYSVRGGFEAFTIYKYKRLIIDKYKSVRAQRLQNNNK